MTTKKTGTNVSKPTKRSPRAKNTDSTKVSAKATTRVSRRTKPAVEKVKPVAKNTTSTKTQWKRSFVVQSTTDGVIGVSTNKKAAWDTAVDYINRFYSGTIDGVATSGYSRLCRKNQYIGLQDKEHKVSVDIVSYPLKSRYDGKLEVSDDDFRKPLN
jgi:hypothetical protein